MSIYSLYSQNENRAGFWIQHRTWQGRCACVQSIGGQSRGKLPGSPPNHDDSAIIISCFDVRSGRCLQANHLLELPSDRGFVRIAQPPWSARALQDAAASV